MKVLQHSFLDLSANEFLRSNIYPNIEVKKTHNFEKVCFCI